MVYLSGRHMRNFCEGEDAGWSVLSEISYK